MTNEAQVLFRLQTVDLEIEEKSARLRDVESRLGESATLREARQAVEGQQKRFHAEEITLREREWDVEDLKDKINGLERNLYGDRIKNPKELAGLQKEVEHLKGSLQKAEDRLLEIMLSIDETRERLREKQERLAHVKQEWESEQKQLTEQQSSLVAALTGLRAERDSLAAGVSRHSLEIYERLKVLKRGKAVAKVEQNTCQGCRIHLPMNEVQLARTSRELVFCSMCGRILWAGR
ncbi:MAG: C4-type zinc ribbon domain-containing protein [Chloroflexi bacterium]|nr:C4-type zinc ribbon domain-containing protein [Chloroflexota bacterium]MCL5075661.1 C4-type zinc ribbon domain-containing protein [Chloroflexota bacterium]